jgi:hypothetical protein
MAIMLISHINVTASLDFFGILVKIYVIHNVELGHLCIHNWLLLVIKLTVFAIKDSILMLLRILVYLIVLYCPIAMDGKIQIIRQFVHAKQVIGGTRYIKFVFELDY